MAPGLWCHKRCLRDTRRPPGVFSLTSARGSAGVDLYVLATRGIYMDVNLKNSTTNGQGSSNGALGVINGETSQMSRSIHFNSEGCDKGQLKENASMIASSEGSANLSETLARDNSVQVSNKKIHQSKKLEKKKRKKARLEARATEAIGKAKVSMGQARPGIGQIGTEAKIWVDQAGPEPGVVDRASAGVEVSQIGTLTGLKVWVDRTGVESGLKAEMDQIEPGARISQAGAETTKLKVETATTANPDVPGISGIKREVESDDTLESDCARITKTRRVLLKVSIALDGYPEAELSKEQRGLIQFSIVEAVCGLPEGTPAPQFDSAMLKKGVLTVICKDEMASKWLTEIVPSLRPWEGAVLRVLNPADIDKYTRAQVWIPGPYMETSMILAALEKQNKGLVTDRWIVHNRGHESVHGFDLILEIDELSVKVLKTVKCKPNWGLGKIKFRLHKRSDVF